MVNAHEHVAGRPRDYISRKWFHRGRHRPNTHRETVDEITQQLNAELALKHPTGFHLSADGKFYVWQGTMRIEPWTGPDTEAFVMIEPPNAVVDIPAFDIVDDCPGGLLSKLEGGPW